MAENRVIGNEGTIPWHLPEDFKFFKATTMGHAILMGRKTYESIGKPLPGRENIVLSRTMPETQGITVIRSLDELNEPTDGRDLFVIGGEEIYRLLLPKVQELYVTRVKTIVDGDTHFPEFMNQFDDGEKVLEKPDFTTFLYRRLNGDQNPLSTNSIISQLKIRSRLTHSQNDSFKTVLRFHNRAILILLMLFGLLFCFGIKTFLMEGVSNQSWLLVLWVVFCSVLVFTGLLYIPKADASLCVKLNFLCTFCKQPLYRGRESSCSLQRGICPRCNKYIGVEGAEERNLYFSDWSR